MRTIKFRTDDKAERIATRLQAEGYVPMLACYEHQGGIHTTMQWDRHEQAHGGRIHSHIWLSDDGYLCVEVAIAGVDVRQHHVECCQTRDVEVALERAALTRAAFEAEICKAAA